MKKDRLEHNIYVDIKPLQFVSRILGLSPLHIDPNYTFRSKDRYTYCQNIQATVIITLLLCGLCNSVLNHVEYNEPTFNTIVRIVWIINVLVSHLTSVLAFLFSVTRSRNHMTNIMSWLSCVHNKLFRNNSKQDACSKQRSQVKMQLWITLILFVTVVISFRFSCSDGTWMNMASQILSDIINTVMMFQYVNVEVMMKQRYKLV
jgi:hypothetical protein